MIKFLSWGLFMGFVMTGFSQTVRVTDIGTGESLKDVYISSSAPVNFTSTNSKGEADISIFRNADTVTFEHLSYATIRTTFAELQKNQFTVQMGYINVMLNEVVVSAYKEDTTRNTSLHIESLQLKDIDERGTFSLTDALSTVPGVSQLSTGIGITKPVIRGLYGNRILVLYSGLRFDNQQWQDEHGMGLSNIGVSGVELIKGPLSILYGTEAIGGIINILEENPPAKGTTESDVQMLLHSNTQGGTIQVGTKTNWGNKWYVARIGVTDHSDYSDGNQNRVLNSRFNGLYLQTAYGFNRKNWQSSNHYNFSYNKFGFVFENYNRYIVRDARWSKAMSGPHHIVMLNMLSSQNRIQLKGSELTVNAGIQSNLRSEDEGGGELSLIMHLLSGQYAAKWRKPLTKNRFLVIANNSILEQNLNFGKRKIVPDAFTAESGLSAYMKYQKTKIVYEYGFGGGIKHIETFLTKTVNSLEKDISPFQQTRLFGNGMIGLSYHPVRAWNVKANISSGVRAPNLAELSSNGLHEGIYTYEIGNPDLKNERNINGDIVLSFDKSFMKFTFSGFYNHFNNYIYLEPTKEEWFGFPVYRFKQFDANIYGGEINLSITPPKNKRLKFSMGYSALVGRLSTGIYLPYMPANTATPEIHYQTTSIKKWVGFCFINTKLVMQQNLINPQEKFTPSYHLINAGIGLTTTTKGLKYVINLSGNNLLNEAYYDHLSRYKNFGLLNLGRNISINLKITTINNLKKNRK